MLASIEYKMAGWNTVIAIGFDFSSLVTIEQFSEKLFDSFNSLSFTYQSKLTFECSPIFTTKNSKEFEFSIQVDHSQLYTNLPLKFTAFVSITNKICINAFIIGETRDSDEFIRNNNAELINELKYNIPLGVKNIVYRDNYELESVEELLNEN
ncbi:hypothetical protein [Flammeovirga sp. EKP202]|uniref:hypothetical protein n=1 Tax=Flammeovirga sp. EKP202 TaxID=2770592 RepID=UPI00165FAC28|nr:hypothetical protein [Flammeovirga sp. EKP202]MBD0404088.1 hypothetical protein [Flammeovirga sp. EKP202]